LSASAGWAAERRLIPSEALAIADREAQRRGYSVGHMNVSLVSSDSVSILPQPELIKRPALQGRSFWMVHYASSKPQLGRDIWICVDLASGDILDVLQGK